MNCYNHPDRVAVGQCFICHKALCDSCAIERSGYLYCQDDERTRYFRQHPNEQPYIPPAVVVRQSGPSLTKVLIVMVAIIGLVLFFLLAPIVPFQCQTFFSTSGSVSLSCEVLGFGEVYQQAFGQSGVAWSSSCQIQSGPFVQCSVGFVYRAIRPSS
jgi:hypothetical protein